MPPVGDLDPLDIEGQERRRIERDDRDKQAQRLESEDLKWLMSSKRGRRFVWRRLERAGVFRLSFDATAMRMAFNEGRRNEGLELLVQVLGHCPERFVEMLVEHRKHDDRNADDGRDANQ